MYGRESRSSRKSVKKELTDIVYAFLINIGSETKALTTLSVLLKAKCSGIVRTAENNAQFTWGKK